MLDIWEEHFRDEYLQIQPLQISIDSKPQILYDLQHPLPFLLFGFL